MAVVGRLSSLCLLTAAIGLTAHAQPLTFTTLAGPAGGAGSSDGTGNEARFSRPESVATDAAGNIYVADYLNDTIRKISPAGVVTTLAGRAGAHGTTNATGSAARFYNPRGVATDSSGNVYVSDYYNHTIRKITSSGVVTKLAGQAGFDGSANGTGGAAQFDRPAGLATDASGNVYVADSWNHTIRKITPAGAVTKLAGSTGNPGYSDGFGSFAQFSYPVGIATDRAGNVYVADQNTIRKVTPDGDVTTFAGSAGSSGSVDGTGPDARFRVPTGVATDSAGNIYVADSYNHTIRKITPARVVTTLAGSAVDPPGTADGTGGAARFDSPTAVATDAAGNVYVADDAGNTIRKVTPAGVVTTLAGVPTPHFGSADGTGTAARFQSPNGVATDSVGNVFVADYFNGLLRKITPAGVVTTVAGSTNSFGTGVDGTGSAGTFGNISNVATDSAGNVYVADTYNQTIRKVTPAGVVTTIAGMTREYGNVDGTGNAARFSAPTGVATDGAGNIYVADSSNRTIRKVTPAGVVTTLAGSQFPIDYGLDGTGSAASFHVPVAVATDNAGNIYVADNWDYTIRKITPAAVVTTLAGLAGSSPDTIDGTGSAARFDHPVGVAADGAGNVYVAGYFTDVIRKVTPAGVVTTIGGSPNVAGSEDGTGSAARFSVPQGVATDSLGNLYVADRDNNSIRVGRPGLADAATIDAATGSLFATRQLNSSPQTATSWHWRVIRRPSGSNALLSSTSIRNPTFSPDVADLFIFQLTASDGVKTSITNVELMATPANRRRPTGR